jgi:sulfide:quinone oxidoreductase
MAEIVILGGGIGGISAAYEMKRLRRGGDRITVVSNVDYFQFTPSNPWVAAGWRSGEAVTIALGPVLAGQDIGFLSTGAKRVHPATNEVELYDGRRLAYDHLIIATGPRLAFDDVPGLGPTNHTHSVCTVEHAEQSARAWERFTAAPGPIVVGAVQGASCFGPAYEFAFIMDTDLRRRRIRDRVPMTFVTSEPYIGHLGLDGVGDSKGKLESEMRERHIRWICNAKVRKVEAGKMHVTELDEEGDEKRTHELPFDYGMMLPAFVGIEAVAGIEGLSNPRGFILIDEYQRNPRYPNIYGIGVCVAIPPIEQTPVPTGVPKTGYMIESMATAACENIRAAIDGRAPHAQATWNAICLADMGDTGIAFVAIPEIPPRNRNWMKKGKWVHWAKVGFESYFLRKVRKGISEPAYERAVLKLLGLERLKREAASTASARR